MEIKIEAKEAKSWPFVVAWAVLALLTAISIGTAFLGLGIWAPIAELGITALQVAIVLLLFMRLKGPPSLKWVFAGSGFFWLLFLFGLSFTDYASRRGWPWTG